MRILLLSSEFPPGPGGVGTLAYQTAYHLNWLGWEVVVSTPQSHIAPGEVAFFNARQPFAIHTLRTFAPAPLEGLYRLNAALRIVRQQHPKIILTFADRATLVGALVSRMTGIPLIAVGIGSEFLRTKPLENRISRWAWNQACRLTAISAYTADLMHAFGLKQPLTVIPCGADDILYQPGLEVAALRESLALGSARVILTVGQLSERKAQDTVIRALPRILKRYPDAIYVMVGLPTRRDELFMLAESIGVTDHIIFTSSVPTAQLPLYYNLADVFVLVSRRTSQGDVEGYGIVTVEAALCGVPSVVSRDCGLAEAVIENETALVVNPDDPQATAEAITTLLTDTILRNRMGQAALQYAREHATWSKRGEAYAKLFYSVLKED